MRTSNLSLFNLKEQVENNNEIFINKNNFIKTLTSLEQINDKRIIKDETIKIIEIIKKVRKDKYGLFQVNSDKNIVRYNADILVRDLTQISEALTNERTKYYIKRMKKSINEVKTNKINDINLNRWKEYSDIITDSLWILEKRDQSGAHNAGYWGNFIPQIPNQFLKRFTKKGDWVLDPFLGSGTTLIECKRLGRNGIGVELLPDVVDIARKNINLEQNRYNVQVEIINADSAELNFSEVINKLNIKKVQLLIMHPPYWDIIKFSNNEKDLSNAENVEQFLELFGKIIDNTFDVLEKNRYLAVVIGDKYFKGEWIPLGFYTMNEVLKRRYKLKSIIVKNYEETKGKMKQKELWRYRALVGGFYIFKHEYILLFQKANK